MISILIGALVLAAIQLRIMHPLISRKARLVWCLVVLAIGVLPYPWGWTSWVISITSDFSISSGLLALVAIQHRVRGQTLMPIAELRSACWLIAVLALAYYPMSLGATYLDPYGLGYGSFELSTALLLVGFYAWISRAYGSCIVLIAAQVAYWFGALGSDNLWDYLVDPFLCFWVFGWLIRDALKRRQAEIPA
ncbi:MAG: hypothetical protein P1U67_11840 [Alcanivoracaceae bacterium]|nr:hypothetical protein [Alcanivoracaceae bacterium]